MNRFGAWNTRRIGACLLTTLALLPAAQAATITVNTLEDEINDDGDCSLREAIEASNLNTAVSGCVAGEPGQTAVDTIAFDAALAGQTIVLDLFDGDFEDGNASGDLDILDGNLVIAGPGTGPGSIIIDGAGDQVPVEQAPHRVLHVPVELTFFTRLELRDLTLRNGSLIRNQPAAGGGLLVEPAIGCTPLPAADPLPCVSLNRVDIVDNSVTTSGGGPGQGGGLAINLSIDGNTPGAIAIQDSRINQNTVFATASEAAGGGALLRVGGLSPSLSPLAVDVSGSEFSGNSVTGDGELLSAGGGLTIAGDNFSGVSITDSRFTDNAVSGALPALGGGADLRPRSQTPFPMTISGSQFLRNQVSSQLDVASGGGLDVGASNLTAFTLSNSELADNLASGAQAPAFGGGASLLVDGSAQATGMQLSITGNSITNNDASGNGLVQGGGLDLEVTNLDSGLLDNNRVVGNNALHGVAIDGGDVFGGGAWLAVSYNPNSTAQLFTIRNSEFSENRIPHAGGGPANRPEAQGGGLIISVEPNNEVPGCPLPQTCLALANLTISGNLVDIPQGNARAGGLGLEPNTITTANNLTIFANEVRGILGFGGGLRMDDSSQLTLSNSIIAGNLSPGSTDCSLLNSSIVSLGFNFVGDSTSCGIAAQDGDQLGGDPPIDPQLDMLASVGDSFTRVHLPLAGSPVLDAGNSSTPGAAAGSCEVTDQIGTPRPQDGDGDTVAICDIGAAELLANLPPEVISPLADQTLTLGGNSFMTDLNNVFTDPEGAALTFAATAFDSSVVSVSVVDGMLAVASVGEGESPVDITAFDDQLASTTISPLFTVSAATQNQAPRIVASIPDQNLPVGGGAVSIDLNGVFEDPEGDELLFEAQSSNPAVVTVSVDGALLLLEPGEAGVAQVVITALDTAAQATQIRLKSRAGFSGSGASASGGGEAATLGGGSGGGCSLTGSGSHRIDPLFGLLILSAGLALYRRSAPRKIAVRRPRLQ